MKKMYWILFLGLLLFPITGKAACSNSENVKLKNIAGNINLTYVFKEENGTFDITLSNVRGEVYVKTPTGQILSSTGEDITIGGYAPNQSYGFKVYTTSNNCPNKILLTKYITTPSYNPFYNKPVCTGAEEYKYCQKWIKNPYSEGDFEKVVNQYKEEKNKKNPEEKKEEVKGIYDYLMDFYSKYYYFILPVIIGVCLLIIFRRKKKEEFF